MTLKKLGISVLLLCALLGGALFAVHARNLDRREKIDAQFPAIGQFITVDGARVHYKTSGSGPDIVLIHGASANLREWEFGLRAALEDRFTVTALDRPGHGHSGAIKGGDHLAAQAAHLRAAAQALGIKTPVLLGHSYGGAVALAWALQEPPKSLVLVSAPVLPWPDPLDIWYRATSTKLGRAFAVPLAAALVPASYVQRATAAVFAPQPLPDTYLSNFGVMLAARAPSLAINTAQVNALYDDIVAQMGGYAQLSVHTELIYGTSDKIVPAHVHGRPVADILPNTRLTLLDGVGHMPHHSHLDSVLSAVDRAAAN